VATGKGTGKPCGNSHISNKKVCRVDFSAALNKVMNAAAGEIGMLSIAAAVQKVGGKAAYAKLEKIKKDLKAELGGNIVKGPKADLLRQRAIEAGLLPSNATEKKEAVEKYADRNVKSLISGYNLIKRVGGFETNANQMKIALAERGVHIEDLTPPPKPSDNKAIVDKFAIRNDASLQMAYQLANKVGGFESHARQIKIALEERGLPIPKLLTQPSTDLKGLGPRVDAAKFDRLFDKLTADKITNEGDKSFNKWGDSSSAGSKTLGSGSYGTVMKDSSGKYAVKRGDISSTEAQLIDKLGKAGLGPDLIAANINGPGSSRSDAVDIRKGRIAMSIVEGIPIGTGRYASDKIGDTKVADAYWEARAKLHRMNIAHNDMHVGNVLINEKSGKAKFVDLGLAQEGPKFALAEAMGAFAKPEGSEATRVLNAQGNGDWQIRQWEGTGGTALADAENKSRRNAKKQFPAADEFQNMNELKRASEKLAQVYQNKNKVWAAMRKDGLSDDDIATVMEHGIRSSAMSYTNGVWKKMSDEQAERYIATLYEGI